MFFHAFMCDKIKMDELKKKKRSENWTKEDKETLQQLIREIVNVIENKNTDTNTNQRKNKAWKDVEESFNQVASSRRNVNQLKCQWTIIKVNARKSDSVHKQAVSKTGGGPPPQESAVSSNDLRAWLPNEFVLDHNEFESDQLLTKTVYNELESEEYLEDVIIEEIDMSLQNESTEHRTQWNSVSKGSVVEKLVENDSTEYEPATENKKKQKAKAASPTKDAKKVTKRKKTAADAIAENEIKCRKELHQLQMENERKRSEILDLERELLIAKINRCKNQMGIWEKTD